MARGPGARAAAHLSGRIHLDRVVAVDGPLHRADARAKFVLAVAAILAVSLVPVGAFGPLALTWVALLLLSAYARVGVLRASRDAVVAVPFALAALPLVFTRPGEPLGTVALGPMALTASAEGLATFLTVLTKSWLSVQVALLLGYTTPFPALLDGLGALRVPPLFIAVIGLMYRYLAVLVDEAGRLMRARASRSAARPGGRAGGPLGWRARVAGEMAGSLFLRSYERSDRVYAAMLARGYQGTLAVPHVRPLRPTERAAIAGGLVALALFAALANVVGR